jgi:hypothetical protein
VTYDLELGRMVLWRVRIVDPSKLILLILPTTGDMENHKKHLKKEII